MDASAEPANRAAYERFVAACGDAARAGRLQRLLLSGYRGTVSDLQKASVRVVALRGMPHLSFVYRHARRDTTQNLPLDEGLVRLGGLIGGEFTHAHLFTADLDWQLVLSRKGRFSLRKAARAGEASAAPGAAPAAHNRVREHLLSLDRPFLAALGVADAQHRLVPAMARKWRQINKFVEIIGGALGASPLAGRQGIEVLDFGSGKGYLTFALHDHLRHGLGLDARVTGVEVREDLVALCNGVVDRLGLQGLRFERGDVASYPPRPVDVMIALHACDTATDHAIHHAIRDGAAIVCVAPCCHKELRPQLAMPQPLRALLRHGVHLGQEAEMLTDALRALLLEACGYEAQVFEFVSLEHTAKNKMILAVKRAQGAASEAAWAQVGELKDYFGVREQCLESLLRARAPA